MFSFFHRRQNVGLPQNFLRRAFQIHTSLYHVDRTVPASYGASQVLLEMIKNQFPFHSGALEIAEDPKDLKAGSFQNSLGGLGLYCEFDDPQLWSLDRKSIALTFGKHIASTDKTGHVSFMLLPAFAFAGTFKKGVLAIRGMTIAKDYEDGDSLEKVKVDDKWSVIRALYYADQCFLAIIAGEVPDAAQIYYRSQQLTLVQLAEYFEVLKNRGSGHLEEEIQIANNVPLKTYATGPVI